MKRHFVFYDGECDLCRRCREWLRRQPAYFPLVFISFQSPEAFQLCPHLRYLQPERQLIALSDAGEIYLGERAWLMCLYALRDYRLWAKRLSEPALRPLARRFCLLISHHRLSLSELTAGLGALAQQSDPLG